MSNSIFDLEQEMLQFANVTDDIEKVTMHFLKSSEAELDAVHPELAYSIRAKYFAIKELYEIKFQNMWDTFETVCEEYHIAHKLAGLEREEQLQSLFDEKI